MGNIILICIDCGGDGDMILDWQERKRLKMFLEGDRFERVSVGGFGVNLLTEKVIMRLSEDRDYMVWNQLGGSNTGKVKLAKARVRAKSDKGISIMNAQGASQLELECSTPALRDTWVIAINEAIDRAKQKPADFFEQQQNEYQRNQYLSSKEAELQQRMKEAEARRAKYATDLAQKYSQR
mmetsp:Transcript_29173/g.38363  ORF Transcript_29173/g.38363 Transcript_29173/m.38363 type:complete len:181 (+) Transcript_29173:78-620(+)